MQRLSLPWAFALGIPLLPGCGVEAPAPATDPAGAHPELTVRGDAASVDQQTEAVMAWADRASALAIIEIASAESTLADDGRIWTQAVLRVGEVYRDDLGLGLTEGEQLWIEVPGGQVGDTSELSSAAPLLFEGDSALALLTLDEDGNITFDGHNSVLPLRDGALQVCVNPDAGAVRRCIDAGTAVVVTEHLPQFSGADDNGGLPLAGLRDALL